MQTKWRHWQVGDPVAGVVNKGLLKPKGKGLELTDAGAECFSDKGEGAKRPKNDGVLPDISQFFTDEG
jgi:hypothetical protein